MLVGCWAEDKTDPVQGEGGRSRGLTPAPKSLWKKGKTHPGSRCVQRCRREQDLAGEGTEGLEGKEEGAGPSL